MIPGKPKDAEEMDTNEISGIVVDSARKLLGLLINFNTPHLKDGIVRLIGSSSASLASSALQFYGLTSTTARLRDNMGGYRSIFIFIDNCE